MDRHAFRIFLLLYLALNCTNSFSQTAVDSSLAAKIAVSGFCLCKTTIQDLQHLDSNIKLIDVEEMDMGKNCIGEDSRFVNGKGYYSEKYPGLIFQKDPDDDY